MTRFSHRTLYWAAVGVLVLAIFWAYAPALSSYFVLDDFGLLAYSRMLGNPLPIFVHDHFPGSLFYRPLTMLFWWLTVKLFHTASMPQYLCNLLLHLSVALVLGKLAFDMTGKRLAALIAALIFALHPIGIGTSLWLSDRFDLLASVFSLLAMVAALGYRREGRTSQLIATLLLTLAALLSKEIGLVIVAPIGLLWVWPRAGERRFWTRQRVAIVLIGLMSLAWLAWRSWLLQGPGATMLLHGAPLVEIIAQGFLHWVQGYGRFIAFWPRQSLLGRVLCSAGLVLWLVIAVAGVREAWRQRGNHEASVMLLAALALLLMPGIVQSPTTRANAIFFGPPDSPWLAVFLSRFYYLSLCGLSLLLAKLAVLGWHSKSDIRRTGLRTTAMVASVLIMLPMALVAHQVAQQYARGSLKGKALADAAIDSISHERLPQKGCQIYLLDVDKSQRYYFVPFAGAIVKSIAPASSGVRNCLIQGEGTPWFQMVSRDALQPGDVAPMLPLYDGGKRVPWMQISNIEVVYLNLFPGIDPRRMKHAIFLAWQDGHFVDVTDAVRSGQRAVHFQCLRNQQQCQCPGQACPNGLPQAHAASPGGHQLPQG
ncbi:MAG: hypothetical protein WCD36_13195 [Rhodanobacteraceae bacterium]